MKLECVSSCRDIEISVLTCTYNPRKEYLQKAINAISSQSVPQDSFEYVLVDNASTKFPEIDLASIKNLQHIREPELGKIHALISGFKCCRGKMIVIVDDDNVLAPNYLELAWKVYQEMPFLGVWGGQIFAEYEEPPASELAPYTHLLTLCEFNRLEWSNIHTSPAVAGAGMCVRREVVTRFQENLRKDSLVLSLGRTGIAMPGVDDWETSLTACDLGLGMGRIPALKLTHLIPCRRVERSYLLSLQENAAYAYQRYVCSRPELASQRHWYPPLWKRLLEFFWDYRFDTTTRMFRRAYRRGVKRATKVKTGMIPTKSVTHSPLA